MKRLLIFTFALVLSTVLSVVSHGQCRAITSIGPPFGPAITENFDSLGLEGNSSTVPNGFLFHEGGFHGGGDSYVGGDGTDEGADTYSFGAKGSTNRTFGTLRGIFIYQTIGGCFRNAMSSPLRYFNLRYFGKKWRAGTLAGGDKLLFEYSTDATSLTSGTWFPFTQLDYISPPSSRIGAVDGNVVNTYHERHLPRLYIMPDKIFYVRWRDLDVAGMEDGLGIDNFYLASYIQLADFVDIGGRVTTATGMGIEGALIQIYHQDPTVPTAMTDASGYYNAPEAVEAGQTILVCVSHSSHTFPQPCRIIQVLKPVTDADFVANP